jgi:ribosomal protein S18 acetylase RimI-like enzyme
MIERPIFDATAPQHPTVVATLANAFMTDPALNFIEPDDVKRAKMLPKFFALMVKSDCEVGTVLHSKDNEAAALWRGPGHAKDHTPPSFGALLTLLGLFGFGLMRAKSVGDSLEAHLPDGRYQYLHFVGVRSDHQGKGWGGAIIREGIARANAEGLPCWLETATPENVALYQRLGFVTQVEWDVPRGGPHFWGMMREVG